MTTPPAAYSPLQHATWTIAQAAQTLPDIRAATSVVAPVSPPAVVIGPPRVNTRGYGRLLTAQWNVYLVVTLNQYAVDELLSMVAALSSAIEQFTHGVVISAGPGTYPNPGGGTLPAYVLVVQMDVAGP